MQNNDTNTTETIDEVGSNRFKSKSAISNFKKRIITSVILLVFLVLYISLGVIYTLLHNLNYIEVSAYICIAITIIILIISQYEINNATKFNKWYLQIIIIIFSILIFLYPVNFNLYKNFSFYSFLNLGSWLSSWQLPVIIIFFFLFVIIYTFFYDRSNLKGALINLTTSLVITFGLKAFILISLSTIEFNGKVIGRYSFNTIVWIWLMIILSDSFAYLGGMRWGKTKLAPKISPKKTWEGAVIGFSVSFAFGLIYSLLFYFCNTDNKPLFELMTFVGNKSKALEITLYCLFSMAFPIIGLYGDLLFSWIKRTFNIKDFSNLLPGHGGLLDRLDSILFSLFVMFILILVGSNAN
ncbi:phosphatidate cytidylyltransferase [Spiroplasma turonicum]|nr:phosphatidate cytidylyltransferase [Spiroplasma turonicum]ALX70532.1 phosphatidate cytidylyltransferase [Spiroplasma turonicum]